MGKYNRQLYKQIIVNINTKKGLDKIKELKKIDSYNEAISLLIKNFYQRDYNMFLNDPRH